jgi:hypothetical protein
MTEVEFLTEAEKIHKNKFEYINFKWKNKTAKITLKCKICGYVFERTPKDHLKGYDCKKCSIETRANKLRKTSEQFIEEARKVHGDKYDYSLVEYIQREAKVNIFCKKHQRYFLQIPKDHLHGVGCPDCGFESSNLRRKKTKEEFVRRAILIHQDKYDYGNFVYYGATTESEIFCKKHQTYFLQSPNRHLQGHGCPACGLEKIGDLKRKTLEQFIEDARKVHGDKYDYSLVEYVDSFTPVKIICPLHGIFEIRPSNHSNQNQGCSVCGTGKSARKVFEALSSFTEVITEYSFEGCRDKDLLKFDFFLPKYNTVVEYQGEQHYIVIDCWGGKEGLKDRQRKDQIKRDFCKKNNIREIEIPYWEINNLKELILKVDKFPVLDRIVQKELSEKNTEEEIEKVSLEEEKQNKINEEKIERTIKRIDEDDLVDAFRRTVKEMTHKELEEVLAKKRMIEVLIPAIVLAEPISSKVFYESYNRIIEGISNNYKLAAFKVNSNGLVDLSIGYDD